MSDVVWVEAPPDAETYAELRRLVGWDPLAPEAVARGLARSLYAVTGTLDGNVVACGRVVGDGGIYFYLQDVIVHPDHRGRGLGRAVTDRLMAYVGGVATPRAFVALMAASGVAGFYERYGFARRAEDSPGMFIRWPPA